MYRNSLRKKTICFTIIVPLYLFIAFSAFAAEVPDAGQISNSVKDSKTKPTEKAVPNINVGQSPEIILESAGSKIKVKNIQITGQDIYSEEQLSAIIKDSLGKELTLGELQAIAGCIAKYFQSQGYMVANAFIPAQNIKDGVVEITVVVGRYGDVTIRNQSGISSSKVKAFLSVIKSGDYVKQDTLERTILLLNDTSGISAKATLVPGKQHGTADLIIDVKDTAKFTGSIVGDNYENRFTGQTKGGLNMRFHNIGGIGDEVGLGGLYSGKGMNDYHFSYLLPLGGQGIKFGVSHSRLRYSLVEDFVSLNASGIAKTVSVYASYPIAVSRESNLNIFIGYDNKELQDIVATTPSDSVKNNKVWSIALSGESQDAKGSGITGFMINVARGELTMESSDAVISDIHAKTAGQYSKSTLDIFRTKYLNHRLSYHLSFHGQLANKNLNSTEKFPLGGSNGVRAYPAGEAFGDEACVFTGELRWNMPTPNFQLAAFYDAGRAKLNKKPWQGAGINNRSLAGAGFGFVLKRSNNYSIRFDYAWKITSDPATSDTDKNGRFWVHSVKYF